jgi:hypothetical protein
MRARRWKVCPGASWIGSQPESASIARPTVRRHGVGGHASAINAELPDPVTVETTLAAE